MKTTLVVLIAVVIVAAVAAAYMQAGQNSWAGNIISTKDDQASLLQYFSEKTQSAVIEKTGRQIQNFEPFMFMEAFPGLKAEDFEGVEANGGVYEAIMGEVVYDATRSNVISTANLAITEKGMKTFLDNLSKRLGITVTDKASADRIIEQIS